MKMEKKHIDDIQTQTVDEHFKLIQEDNSVIDINPVDLTPNDLPDWYNEKLYKEGQNFYKRNMLSVVAATTVGLILVFSVSTILKVLVYTKRSGTIPAAFKRYVKTLLHIHNLYICDPNDIDSKWYKSLNTIRWNHKTASQRAKNAGLGEITQRDMVLTSYGFVGFIYIAPDSFGLYDTQEEEAFNHFWRVNNYMLGIFDKFNLCRKNVKETTQLCQKIKNLYITFLTKPPSEFHDLISCTLDAIWHIDITMDYDSFMSFTHKLHNLPYKKIGWYSWIMMKYREWLFYLFLKPYVGVVARTFGNFLVKFILWNSKNFPLLAWIKLGRNNSRLNLYPKH